MAITFDRRECCGTAIFKSEKEGNYETKLYVGNCFLIMVYEYTDEEGKLMEQLHSFFVDEGHMKRCLQDDIFTKCDPLVSIRINKAKCRSYKKIVALLMEYMDNVSIEIYKEGEQNWTEYKELKEIIPYQRMSEIADTAISYLKDNDLLEDYMEDRYIEFDEDEKEYFVIYDEEEDEY